MRTRFSPFGSPAIAILVSLTALAAVVGWIAASPAVDVNPNVLWGVVHDLCVVDMRMIHAPAPCAAVDLQARYAVLEDVQAATQILVIPTDRVTGVEDPRLLAPGGPNYWRDAWDARHVFERRAGQPVPREDIGLAVNSAYGRSQDQLHIHVDCVGARTKAAIAAAIGRIGPRWAPLGVGLARGPYRAMRLDGADLGARDPFKLLAEHVPSARAQMDRHTLVLVGARLPNGGDGFVLLDHEAGADAFDIGYGESLLDHSCAVLRR